MESSENKNRENYGDTDQGNKLDTTNKTQDENVVEGNKDFVFWISLSDVNNDNNQESHTPKTNLNKNAEDTAFSGNHFAYSF